MNKYQLNLQVTENKSLDDRHVLIKLTDAKGSLPLMKAGQFVQVLVEDSSKTFLRRPISINYVDKKNNELWLMIQKRGEGTHKIATLCKGSFLNVILPLGNGFNVPQNAKNILLVGGGVGVAPMLYLGKELKEQGLSPKFLIGARNQNLLLEIDLFQQLGDVYITTEDGSIGEKGFVTQHSILEEMKFDYIAVCGPKPMMVAVASYARKNDIMCEVSLENMMACGLGACLCCVEKTVKGNICVCTEGPVFNIKDLVW
ncbi:MAG: dihydroorotate dehydrogenase electron transfer subunit [Prevotellaceae bacterium]|nr:dihydroorotate dehydrogenase electron transfer subunit [Candidatus Faecinaster equi]